VIRPEKACEIYFHIGIVRANKRWVNDIFGYAIFLDDEPKLPLHTDLGIDPPILNFVQADTISPLMRLLIREYSKLSNCDAVNMLSRKHT